MDCELINAMPVINNLCTIACIGCVLPTSLNVVLIAILVGITWVTRVSLWSTVVLTCTLANWAGFAAILWILS